VRRENIYGFSSLKTHKMEKILEGKEIIDHKLKTNGN
jgi:hypothetical protein